MNALTLIARNFFFQENIAFLVKKQNEAFLRRSRVIQDDSTADGRVLGKRFLPLRITEQNF